MWQLFFDEKENIIMNKYNEMLERIKNDEDFNKMLEKTIMARIGTDKDVAEDDAKRLKKLIAELERIKDDWSDALNEVRGLQAEYSILLEQMFGIKRKLGRLV